MPRSSDPFVMPTLHSTDSIDERLNFAAYRNKLRPGERWGEKHYTLRKAENKSSYMMKKKAETFEMKEGQHVSFTTNKWLTTRICSP
jgi:hypothetical protein